MTLFYNKNYLFQNIIFIGGKEYDKENYYKFNGWRCW